MIKKDTISFPVSKSEMSGFLDGSLNEFVRPLSKTICKKMSGLAIVCPYSMPSPEVMVRICQKTGTKCLSGFRILKFNVKFYCTATKESKTFGINRYTVDENMNVRINVIPLTEDEEGDSKA